jgi:polyhydroxybutyrate depolymerase
MIIASQRMEPATASVRPSASASCTSTAGLTAGKTAEQQISSGGKSRTYLLHLPAGYNPKQPTPVVLAFHGRKGTGNDIEQFSGIDSLDAIAVYPRGLAGPDHETSWEGAPETAQADDVRFVSDVLDRLQSTLCVDTNRIFATGKSEGGGFTALLACRMSNRIAAFATVSGAFYPGTDAGCSPSTRVPIVDFHGTGDTIMKYNGGVSHGQRYPAMPDWLARWAGRGSCGPSRSSAVGTDVTTLTWGPCTGRAALVHYRITDGGHTWPGARAKSGPGKTTNTISATAIMWSFFRAHPLAGA